MSAITALATTRLFYVPEKGKTMAELSMDEKNEISHRGKALKKLVEALS